MKSSTLRALAAAAILFIPCAESAAEEPEAVYAKFHRGAVSGNLEEMFRYAPAARRAELATMSAAQKDAQVKMVALMLPRAFVVRNKTILPAGSGARLLLSGPGERFIDGKVETLYGVISMVIEAGDWKVSESNWSNEPPASFAAARPAAAPAASAAGKAPAKAAAKAPPASMVGTSAPRTLGAAKPPCVYKAVMTAEDVENCR